MTTQIKNRVSDAASTTLTAPPSLATVSDLGSNEVREIAEAVNPLVADAFALYLKTKNFHWHLSGLHFRDYHLLLDEQADELLGMIDPLAERVRKVGGTTLRSVGHISRLQRVADNEAEIVPLLEMLRELMEDNRAFAAAQRQAHEICDRNRDVATASLLENFIDETEKRTWFLFEVIQKDF